MDKIIITVLGKDRPGIIASVSKSLYKMDCNLQNVNQMILQNQFAGFFIVEYPLHLNLEMILEELENDLKGQNLKVYADVVEAKTNGVKNSVIQKNADADNSYIRSFNSNNSNNKSSNNDEEIFLFTTIGPDQKGLVARFSEIIASYNVNITNLTAIFKGGDEPSANIMSYQIAIKPDTDQAGLFKALRDKAQELGLDISIQHKNIFETINKI